MASQLQPTTDTPVPRDPASGAAHGGTYSASARQLGIWSALSVFLLGVVYLVITVIGLASRSSSQAPIPDPYFSLMEGLILVLAPTLVIMMAVVHAWAPQSAKTFTLLALIFMSLMAGVSCGVHFTILTVSHVPAVAALPWLPYFLSFSWPSVAYALDILAWDVFYGLSVLFAAAAFTGDRLLGAVRALMVVSGVLAIGGLSGVIAGDMQLRLLVGVTGYGVLGPVIALVLVRVFQRTESIHAQST